MKPIALFLFFVCLPSLAEELKPLDDSDFKPNPWQASVRAAVAISGPSSVSGSDSRVPLSLGGGIDYYFSRAFGAFTELHGTTRGFRVGAASASASFVDLWFGAAFRSGGRWFAQDSMTVFKLGGIYAQPLANYSGTLSPSFGNGSRGYWGIAYGQDTLFPAGESLKIGFSIWGKLGLGDATRPTAGIKFYEAGFGLCAAFR